MKKYWHKNKVYIKNDIGHIALTDNAGNDLGTVLVDKVDLIKCYKYKWHLNSKGYVFSTKIKQTIGRYVLSITDSRQFVCHLNANNMDNRRKNLNIEII